MPVYELACNWCRTVEEVYLRRWSDADPACPVCLGARERLASRFGVVFTGPITRKYLDQKKEGAHLDGVWDYRMKSSISGQPEPVFLSSWDEIRAFNKAEGLTEAAGACTISTDGKKLSNAGMPGAWNGTGMPSIPARLKEIIEMPADQIPQAAATATPVMPMSHGMKAEAVEPPPELMDTWH